MKMDVEPTAGAAQATDGGLKGRRRAAARALGLDPETIVWPNGREGCETTEPLEPEPTRLNEAEWRAIAPLLPREAPQTCAMSNREFLEAVLEVMRRNGAWTSRHSTAAEMEAVRRRFGRWAHQGVFKALGEALPELGLAAEHQRQLALAIHRAAILKARAHR